MVGLAALRLMNTKPEPLTATVGKAPVSHSQMRIDARAAKEAAREAAQAELSQSRLAKDDTQST